MHSDHAKRLQFSNEMLERFRALITYFSIMKQTFIRMVMIIDRITESGETIVANEAPTPLSSENDCMNCFISERNIGPYFSDD